jgi:hypothetical protein
MIISIVLCAPAVGQTWSGQLEILVVYGPRVNLWSHVTACPVLIELLPLRLSTPPARLSTAYSRAAAHATYLLPIGPPQKVLSASHNSFYIFLFHQT